MAGKIARIARNLTRHFRMGLAALCSALGPGDQHRSADREREQCQHRHQDVTGEVGRDLREERVPRTVGQVRRGTERERAAGRTSGDERHRNDDGGGPPRPSASGEVGADPQNRAPNNCEHVQPPI